MDDTPRPAAGGDRLVFDLEVMVENAVTGLYSDECQSTATPKMDLVRDLQKLIDDTKNGEYDD